jgi:hypothetical protein
MITTTTTAAAKQQQQQRRASAAAVGEDATAAAEGSWSMLMGSPTERSSDSPQAARGRDAAEEEEEVVAPPPNWCGTQTDWPLARSYFVLRLTFLEFAPSLSGRENIIMVVQIPTSSQMSAHQEALFVCGCRAAAARWLAQAHTHRKAVWPTY